MSSGESTYDDIPYTSYSYPLTHPDRLITVGRLFGMDPPEAGSSRVLELGCASGGNLIPMAEQFPDAEFVGVDLSKRQVDEGTAAIGELGLKNVTLHHADIETVDADWGIFDFVLCHGVYSWVPPRIQNRILEICRVNLSHQGIAYVSYNTYPGWHVRESVRHMTRFHTAQFRDARQQTEQAAALVDFLASAVSEEDLYGQLLRRELDILARTSPEYLFHEHLEEHNEPLYFHQFVERVVPKGLQFLGEADVHTMLARELNPAVHETLGRISPDIIALEQYTDFVRNRQFRQTLLCRAELELDRNLRPELIPQFVVGFNGSAVHEELDLRPDVEQTFASDAEIAITSSMPISKAALAVAGEHWPDAMPFSELCRAARARLEATGIEASGSELAEQQLAVDLLACFLQGTVELRTSRPPLCSEPGPRPLVSAYARWQVARGDFAANRRHVRVDFDEATCLVVGLLDGTRDREAIVDGVADFLRSGALKLSDDDGSVTDPEVARELLTELVDQTLAHLGAYGMLLA